MFSITTAIDYPNGRPHMGHAFEKIVTDTYARYARQRGQDVFFLTGTDENGQKLVKSAEEAGMTPMAYVDQNVEYFKDLCLHTNIQYDDFIRTTEPRHHKTVAEIWAKLETAGDIYQSSYEGTYCLDCEAYYTEIQAPDGKCPEHHKPLESRKEDGFFFRTSKYQDWIIAHIESHPDFVNPDQARKEILARLKSEPIRDLSITRPNKGWGIPVPVNPDFVIYTWFDALINYYTACVTTSGREKFWPSSVHVIGRDILWFHAVIWPMMLYSAKLPLPKQVYVHGMILAEDGKKMSKSLGNGVDPMDVLKQVPVDSFRYYLLRAIPAGANGAFVMGDLLKRHQTGLGKDYGNLVLRIIKLARKRLGDAFPSVPAAFDFVPVVAEVDRLMNAREHHRALELIWGEVNRVNGFVNIQAPWAIKEDEEKFKRVLTQALYGLDVVTQLLFPFIPQSAEKVLRAMGHVPAKLSLDLRPYQLSEPEVLFPRIEKTN